MMIGAKPWGLEPWPVHGGFRIAWVRWFLAGRDADAGWDQEHQFFSDEIFLTQDACRAAIANVGRAADASEAPV